ncbi:MAG TPA: MFS transporter [Chloroflexia bacterium]|nr:MFS transporter [Chloroflexia bacterium]
MATGTLQQRTLWTRFLLWVRNSPPMRYPDLGLICLGSFVMLVGVGAIVPIRTIYARDHGSSMSEIGFMASAFLLGQFAMQLPGGWASDKFGRRPVLVTGITVSGLILFLFLLNDNPWYFIGLRFVEGAASGVIGPAANAYVIDSVPAKDRGAAFGWLGSAFSAGFMMGPALGGFMVDLVGYEAPFVFGGITSLMVAVFLLWKMSGRTKAESVQVAAQSDEDIAAESARSKRQVPSRLFVPALIGALAFTVASGFGDGLFISIWTVWLNDLHASTSFIGFTFITFSLPLMLLMPSTGKMADKYSLTPLIVVPGVLISFAYLAYGFASNIWFIALWGLFEGALVAVMVPAVSAYVANLSPDNARGRLQGFISTVRAIAGFGSAYLVARLYGNSMSYPFFMLAGVQLFISLAGGLLVWRIERSTRQS